MTGKAEHSGRPDPLRINVNPLKFGGVMGRVHYLSYALGFGIVTIVAVALYYYYAVPIALPLSPFDGTVVAVSVIALLLLVISYSAAFRRMRDIRGTTENDFFWRVLTGMGLSLPVVNLFVLAVLYYVPGKITGRTNVNPFVDGPEAGQHALPSRSEFSGVAHTAAFQGVAASPGAGPIVASQPPVEVDKLVANCPHCSLPCKVHVDGKYRCPNCGAPFTYANGEVGI